MVRDILRTHDEGCDLSSIGFYPTLDELVARVRGSKNWTIGSVFVWAERDDRFVIMKQIAPDSCEMLTITNEGFVNVLTAYRFQQDYLVKMLSSCMHHV